MRRLPLDDTARRVEELSRLGVAQAWAGSFDAVLHNDIAAANQRLTEECRSAGADFLLPFGAVNLSLPEWEDDIKRCSELHGMLGIRLLPGYHDFPLSDERFVKLLNLASEMRMIVQIAVRLEDPRTQHHLLSVKDVDLKPLLDVLQDYRQVPIVLLNGLSSVSAELHSQARSDRECVLRYCNAGRTGRARATSQNDPGRTHPLRITRAVFYARVREAEAAGI